MKLKTLSLLAAGLIVTGAAGAEYYAGAGYGYSWNGGHAWTNGVIYDFDKFSNVCSFFGIMIQTLKFGLFFFSMFSCFLRLQDT